MGRSHRPGPLRARGTLAGGSGAGRRAGQRRAGVEQQREPELPLGRGALDHRLAQASVDVGVQAAQVVARRPPLAAKFAKQAVLAADEMALQAGLLHERRLYELAMATEDRVEGMTAFLEKRKPEFRGR